MLISRLQNKAADKQWPGIISNFYIRVNKDRKSSCSATASSAHVLSAGFFSFSLKIPAGPNRNAAALATFKLSLSENKTASIEH